MLKLTKLKRAELLTKVFNRTLKLSDQELIGAVNHLGLKPSLKDEDYKILPLVLYGREK